MFYAVAFLVVLTLGLAEPGALEQLMVGEIGGMKITPELMLLLTVIILTPFDNGFPVPDPEGFSNSLGKHHRGLSLHRSSTLRIS